MCGWLESTTRATTEECLAHSAHPSMQGTYDRTSELFAIADGRCKMQGHAPADGALRRRVAQHALRQPCTPLDGDSHSTPGKAGVQGSLFDDPAVEIGEISSAVRESWLLLQ